MKHLLLSKTIFAIACAILLTNCNQVKFTPMSSHSPLSSLNITDVTQLPDLPNPPNPLDCMLGGRVIANGANIEAFEDAAVDSGATCESEIRTCTNGVLSGSYTHLTCINAPPNACIFNGQALANGSSVVAYESGSVPSGGTCNSEVRQCTNGVLSGSFTFADCTVGQLRSCTFNGQTLAHGQSVTAYSSSTAPNGAACESETRTCNDGTLSGSFAYATCSTNNGQPQACLFNGETIPNGQSVNAYKSSTVPYGSTCQSESRLCTNGLLSGSYAFASCQIGQPASCLFNGQTIAHGQTVTAFQSSTSANCTSEQRTCNNGALTGSYQFGSCVNSQQQPASCLFNGQTIPHGQLVTAYQSSSVGYGQSCSAQQRMCTNGTLSGSFAFASCSIGQPVSCLINGQTIAHGQSVTNFFESNPAFGVACRSESRTCSNGNLSGSFAFQGCTEKICAPYASESCGHMENGSFQRTCNPDGMGYGACVQACNPGHVMIDGVCKSIVNECPANEVRSCTYSMSLSGDMGYSLLAFRQSCREDGRWYPAYTTDPGYSQFWMTDCAGYWYGPYGNSHGVGLRDNGTPLPY